MVRRRVTSGVLTAGVLAFGTACGSTAPSALGTSPPPRTTPPAASPSPTLSPLPSGPGSPLPSVPSSPSMPSSPPRPTTALPSTSAPPSMPQVSTALVFTTAHSGRYVALTFDDGPHPTYTPQILALLRRYGAHATFCEIGRNAQAFPDLVRQVVADGNRLCDHTQTHDEHLGTRPTSTINQQIVAGKQALLQLGGGAPLPYYRQPGGNWTMTIRQVAADNGMQPLAWSVDPRDWSMPGTAAIVARVEANLRPGSVLLMHDGDGDLGPGAGDRSQSVAALAILLPWMIQQGYRFDYPG